MSVLTPELREARVGISTLIGVLNRRGLCSMCLHDVWSICAGQPPMVGIGYAMRFIQPQAIEGWRGGEA